MDLCRTLVRWSLLPAAFGLAVVIGLSPASGQDDGDAAANEAGLQELTRGPVHEAFAEPITFNPKPGLIVKKQPPEAIEELPPEQKPDGENVAFIAGYWSHDDDKDDWIYISGIWRVIPPGKQWVAGYWNKMESGHQWVSGYWANASNADAPAGTAPANHKVEYFPEPPPSLEIGANTDAPSPDHIWVSGCYTWYDNHYVWRGGYWIVSRPNWVWIPAHYKWTPCGYVFCSGGWDLAPTYRGVCFAPCYISPVVYARPRFVYCPRIVIDFDACSHHFFARPSYCHYYFGDYYADHYHVSFGIQPWFRFHYAGGHYCPIYSHYRWVHARDNTRWEIELRDRYRNCVAHADHRPPRTFVQQQTIINNINVKNVNVTNVNKNTLVLAKPLKEVAKQDPKITNMNFVNIQKKDRDALALNAKEVQRGTTQRLALESKAAKELKLTGAGGGAGTGTVGTKPGATGVARGGKPITLDMPTSKIESKPLGKLGKNTPPPLPTGAIRPRGTGIGSGDKPVTGGGSPSGGATTPITGNTKPGGGTGGTTGGGNKPITGGTGTPITGGTTKPGGGTTGGGGTGGNVGGNKPITGGAGTPIIGGSTKPGGGTGGTIGGNKPPMGTGGTTPGGTGSTGGNVGGNKPPMGTGGTTPGGTGGGNNPPGKRGDKPFSDGSGPGGSTGVPPGGSFRNNPPSGSTGTVPGGSSTTPSGGSFKPSNPPTGGGSGKSSTPPVTSGSGGKSGTGSGSGSGSTGDKPKEKKNERR
jgi:hypothetical protein